ncbi:MAG: VWA domain-containing protein [Desulfobulbaceae bacterium]|nr:VWA domain-containing protein [Desulfobulbaceae bacterium]
MNFAQPMWLFVGLSVCICLAMIFRFLQKKREATLSKFASHQLMGQLTRNISKRKRLYKNILLLGAIFACFVAFARPQYGYKWIEVKRKGIDLLFALDTSKSMLAEDIKPNRLKRAHLAILDFVQQLEGDRVGLLPFAGSAYLMCPLTMDYDAFEQSLAAVTTDLIPRGGTNIGEVINRAQEILSNGANHKILIILTDGENLEGDALAAAEAGAAEGLTVYTVGVGTSEGELIPAPGGKGFIKDKSGNFVTSRLDQTTLTEIAEKSNGLYVPLGSAGEGLETIYQQKLALIPKEELAERRHKVPLERFEWPLGAALILLVLEFLIGERRNNGPPPLFSKLQKKLKSSRSKQVAGVLLLCMALAAGRADASEGEKAFLRGDFLQAAEYYSKQLEQSPDDPELLYNYGTSSYKNNMYDDAIDSFSKALKSDDLELQQKAYYNKGNSHYQKGVEMQQGDPNSTMEQWNQAIESLASAIQLAPDDSNAQHNHDLIQQQLEELQKQLENQEQDKQENKEGEQGQDQKQDQQQGDKQNGQDSQESSQQDQTQDSAQQGEEAAAEQGGSENKEQQTAQQKQQEEDAAPATEKEESGDNEKPVAINQDKQEEKGGEEQAQQDTIRRQQGKMTKEEAERLLNALKNEEGELNFVPAGRSNDDNDVGQDW